MSLENMSSAVPPSPYMASSSSSPSSSARPLINLVLRVVTFLLLFISLIILTTATAASGTIQFNSIISYRYMLFTMVIGIVYELLQTAFTIFQVIKRRPLSLFLQKFDYYGDMSIAYILATGAAAAFGSSIDAKAAFEVGFDISILETYFSKGLASASLLLFGFLCAATSSIRSSSPFSKLN